METEEDEDKVTPRTRIAPEFWELSLMRQQQWEAAAAATRADQHQDRGQNHQDEVPSLAELLVNPTPGKLQECASGKREDHSHYDHISDQTTSQEQSMLPGRQESQ